MHLLQIVEFFNNMTKIRHLNIFDVNPLALKVFELNNKYDLFTFYEKLANLLTEFNILLKPYHDITDDESLFRTTSCNGCNGAFAITSGRLSTSIISHILHPHPSQSAFSTRSISRVGGHNPSGVANTAPTYI